MSFLLISQALNNEIKIKPASRMVLVALANHADDTRKVFISHASLAKEMNVSQDAIRHHLKQLVAHKLLRVKRKGGGRLTTVYQLNLGKSS